MLISQVETSVHFLSSLIATNGGAVVAIKVGDIADLTGCTHIVTSKHGKKIAENCSKKFGGSPQWQYDWHVVYVPERDVFVGVRKNF